ncbi:type IV secretion protein Rhs, partial [Flavobacterium columnare]|nr:type IV secretion protein Rhs [Flavobacterium columnare]MBF6658442.1 type IV secretion protein Rhs [Flavobacterium columnare]
IGEEVLVGFESGNAEKPFVLGTHYNGSETSGYHTSGNDVKAIKTRSGIETLANDAEGSWKQSTPDGNYLQFDGQGNATLNIPENLLINVGGNLNIQVGKNLMTSVTLDNMETTNGNKNVSVGIAYALSVTTNYIANIMGSFRKYVKGDIESHTDKEHKTVSLKELNVFSEGKMEHHSESEVQNNSAEKSNSH